MQQIAVRWLGMSSAVEVVVDAIQAGHLPSTRVHASGAVLTVGAPRCRPDVDKISVLNAIFAPSADRLTPCPTHPRGPAREPLVRGLVLAITLRHVLPAQYPEHSMCKSAVIFSRPAYCPSTPRQQRFNPPPLHLSQLIAPNAHQSSATNSVRHEK